MVIEHTKGVMVNGWGDDEDVLRFALPERDFGIPFWEGVRLAEAREVAGTVIAAP
jgi:hypothetical protein